MVVAERKRAPGLSIRQHAVVAWTKPGGDHDLRRTIGAERHWIPPRHPILATGGLWQLIVRGPFFQVGVNDVAPTGSREVVIMVSIVPYRSHGKAAVCVVAEVQRQHDLLDVVLTLAPPRRF